MVTATFFCLHPTNDQDLIDLSPPGRNVADHAVMILGAGGSHSRQKPKDSALGYAGKGPEFQIDPLRKPVVPNRKSKLRRK
jgi:hypothetical protein